MRAYVAHSQHCVQCIKARNRCQLQCKSRASHWELSLRQEAPRGRDGLLLHVQTAPSAAVMSTSLPQRLGNVALLSRMLQTWEWGRGAADLHHAGGKELQSWGAGPLCLPAEFGAWGVGRGAMEVAHAPLNKLLALLGTLETVNSANEAMPTRSPWQRQAQSSAPFFTPSPAPSCCPAHGPCKSTCSPTFLRKALLNSAVDHAEEKRCRRITRDCLAATHANHCI